MVIVDRLESAVSILVFYHALVVGGQILDVVLMVLDLRLKDKSRGVIC